MMMQIGKEWYFWSNEIGPDLIICLQLISCFALSLLMFDNQMNKIFHEYEFINI